MTRLNAPSATDARPNAINSVVVNRRSTAPSTTTFHRAMAYMATASSTPDIIAEIAGGASECASGSQVCIGASPAFVPYPIRMNAKASCSSSGCSDGAASRSTSQFNDPGTSPAVETKSKYASTVPVNASAMPTEQIRMYFHDASTDAFVRSSGMTMADMMVVASTATHMSATLPVVTAASIVNANAFMKMRNRRVRAGSSSRSSASPGPSNEASSATNAMQSASIADSASTRQMSPARPETGPSRTT